MVIDTCLDDLLAKFQGDSYSSFALCPPQLQTSRKIQKHSDRNIYEDVYKEFQGFNQITKKWGKGRASFYKYNQW